MTLTINFPSYQSYATSLGFLRKALKPYIHGLHIRKTRRPPGVLISGSPDKVALVLLILPTDYSVAEVKQCNS